MKNPPFAVRHPVVLIFFLLLPVITLAQQTKKTMIAGIDYVPGKVRVKTKSSTRDEFVRNHANRLSFLSPRSLTPMVSEKLAKKGATWRGPLNITPTIDISQYFEMAFDNSGSLESLIYQLKQTGYFEIVEPVYIAHVSYIPNDPSEANQYQLKNVKAIEAWDITKGSDDITIAIVDTGGELTHPDLSGNLYINTKEIPDNQIDDDGDGFIDNYRGWDFVGADTLNAYNDNFIGDNDPTVFSGGDNGHGTSVAGCASASTDNGIGISGIGFKTKIMFTKQTGDNEKTNSGAIYSGYSGILYAANQGIKIINCSWTSGYASQIEQDLINHITLDLGCTMVAAAGNIYNQIVYPAAYDNVLSAGATDENDVIAPFSYRGPTVDIFAPGVLVYTTIFGNSYAGTTGTSFASPITAGAVALVHSVHPDYNAAQVTALFQATADSVGVYSYNGGSATIKRLNIQRALQYNQPLLQASNFKLLNTLGNPVQSGEAGFLSMDITNLGQPTTSGLKVSVAAGNSTASLIFSNNSISPGAIATKATLSNAANPFQFTNTIPPFSIIQLTVRYSDAGYSASQTFTVLIGTSPLFELNINQITTSIGAEGKVGYDNTIVNGQFAGDGFLFNSQQLVSEIGIMMLMNDTTLYNNVRGAGPSPFDDDFVSTSPIQKIIPGVRADEEIFGEFSNSADAQHQTVTVDYRAMAWRNKPADKFVVMEYKIKNTTSGVLNNFYFGVFADWDISPSHDFADWYASERIGYIYPAGDFGSPYAGTQLLTGNPFYFGLDNNPPPAGTVTDAPFAVNDGFSDREKILTLTTNRLTAGMSYATGTDVSNVVSSGPFRINPGQTITIAFALHAAETLSDLKASARAADSLYNHNILSSETESISVFPNPVQNYPLIVKVNEESGNIVSVSMMNMMGVALFSGEFQTSDRVNQTEINMESFPPGVYILKVKAGNETATTKIIKAP